MVQFPVKIPFDAWDANALAEFMRPLVEPWFNNEKSGAWIHIIDPEEKVINTDIETGTISVQVDPVWSGFSRVQPLRTALNLKNPTNDTITRVIQFWIEFPKDGTLPDLKPGFEIAVEFGLNDPALERHQYIIDGAINASDAWQRTIEAVVNLEARPNYDMSTWPKPPED